MMHSAIAIVAIIVAGVISVYGITYGGVQSHVGNGRTILVSATGSASAAATQEVLHIQVNGTGVNASEATHNLSATMSVINTTLIGYVNGNLSSISTTSYSLTKAYNYTYVNGTWGSVPTGYLATETVRILLPNVSDTGSVLDALSQIPNTYVSSVQAKLSASQIAELSAQALSIAMQNATTQAHGVAGAGVQISPVNVSVSGYYVYPVTPLYSTAGSSLGSVSEPTIYTGTSTVTESVSVLFKYD